MSFRRLGLLSLSFYEKSTDGLDPLSIHFEIGQLGVEGQNMVPVPVADITIRKETYPLAEVYYHEV